MNGTDAVGFLVALCLWGVLVGAVLLACLLGHKIGKGIVGWL